MATAFLSSAIYPPNKVFTEVLSPLAVNPWVPVNIVVRSPDTLLLFLYCGLSSSARIAAFGCTTGGAGCAGGGAGLDGLLIKPPILTSP